MTGLAFDRPWALLLAALAVLPLLLGSGQRLRFSHLTWLPHDRTGPLIEQALRALAALTIACIAVGLAGPHRAETSVERMVRGAEVSVLLDRSASMDAAIRVSQRTSGGALSGTPKAQAVREALARLVASRPDDRFALTLFSGSVLPVLPLTDDHAAVQAALRAAGVGRGLTDTHLGSALVAALQAFERRPYAGSRVVLLVSDGGARLDEATRERIRSGFRAQRLSLYYLYIRSSALSPDLSRPDAEPGEHADSEEWALHAFFRTLQGPYKVYQAQDPQAIDAAIRDIGAQHVQPLAVQIRVPRLDWHRQCFAAAALTCMLLMLANTWRIRAWS